jgi:hypothetical protein
MAETVGQIQVELIFNRDSASGVVPEEVYAQHMADRLALGVRSQWWTAINPVSGEERPAYTPMPRGRVALIERRGIRHGDRYLGTFNVKDITRRGNRQMEMWLVDAELVRHAPAT